MSMPITLPRVAPDAAASAPNAAAAASPDAASPSSPAFGSVLTLLLAHVAQPSTDAKPDTGTNGTLVDAGEAESGESATDGTHGDPTASTGMAQTAGAAHAGQQHGAAIAARAADAHALAAANERSALAGSSLEAAADAAIAEATPDTSDTALNVTVAIAIPTVTVAPDAAHSTTNAARSLDLVVPEFRERLDRVIERMESEFGYKVEVTETYRSQARQNMLYAQGRTDPGDVVTWTRASNHTAGRAADLVVDGSYDNPLAYQRLMRIAREEGLRTLGPRDPGHVELSAFGALGSARGSAEGASKVAGDFPATAVIARPAPSIASDSSIVAGSAKLESPAARGVPNVGDGIARVATVATVGPVARVAQVAQVATCGQATSVGASAPPRSRAAEPGASRARRMSGETAGADMPAAVTPGTATRTGAINATSTDRGEASDQQETSREPNGESRERARTGASARDTAADVLRQTRDELLRAVASADPNATAQGSNAASGADAPASVGHTDMSERIARLLKVQDAAGDRPLSQVVLRLERPDGGEDRLRVDLRGSTVSATLDVADQAAADNLGANVKELQRALERHGFDADSVTVRTSTRAMESSTLARAAGAAAESDLQRPAASSPNTSTNTSSRERGARHDEERPSPDSQRHRSRREQKGDR